MKPRNRTLTKFLTFNYQKKSLMTQIDTHIQRYIMAALKQPGSSIPGRREAARCDSIWANKTK